MFHSCQNFRSGFCKAFLPAVAAYYEIRCKLRGADALIAVSGRYRAIAAGAISTAYQFES
jgi:hypothetical protein